mgnify:CR=1 FL=1
MQLSIGQSATLACLLEVSAPKPGNVHRGADFADATLNDFLASAVAIGPAMENARQQGVGATVLEATRATQSVTATNTNLGAVLLLAPLACVPDGVPLKDGVRQVLAELNADDAAHVYKAIRETRPGGLGSSEAMDVSQPPPADLLDAMQLAAERDIVARQYVNCFADVFDSVVPELVAGVKRGYGMPLAIVHTHVALMSRHADTLIARKCGLEIAKSSAEAASRVLAAGEPMSENYQRALGDLDFWLRSDGNRRNPGATADLIAAGLFVCLRSGMIRPPLG